MLQLTVRMRTRSLLWSTGPERTKQSHSSPYDTGQMILKLYTICIQFVEETSGKF